MIVVKKPYLKSRVRLALPDFGQVKFYCFLPCNACAVTSIQNVPMSRDLFPSQADPPSSK